MKCVAGTGTIYWTFIKQPKFPMSIQCLRTRLLVLQSTCSTTLQRCLEEIKGVQRAITAWTVLTLSQPATELQAGAVAAPRFTTTIPQELSKMLVYE